MKNTAKYKSQICKQYNLTSREYRCTIEHEQKSTNNVEPKFKVGDWCIDNEDNTIYQITNVLANLYYYRTNEGKEYACTQDSIERDAHLWTIQDAKDGDVLANDHHILILKELGYTWTSNCKPECLYAYCGIKPNGNFELEKENYYFCGILHIHPATKEQRDILFQKMKEEGYEWDAEKKELKNIEQKEIDYNEELKKCKDNPLYFFDKYVKIKLKEQTHAWSEEDEEMFDAIIADIQFTQKAHIHEVNQVVYEREIDWFKSLKERMKGE